MQIEEKLDTRMSLASGTVAGEYCVTRSEGNGALGGRQGLESGTRTVYPNQRKSR